jgi:predicted ATPase/DNA-binding CsgD family transcriptional regulator
LVTSSLPRQLTSFIGREAEMEALVLLLNDPEYRLLTIVGPGGIGKTRLALEVVSREAARFTDGVYFVPLQPLGEAEHILTAIIDVLPLKISDDDDPLQQLLDYLRDKCQLLVLDNFEHLLDGVDIVNNILTATSEVKLMVTSRERLNLHTEQVWPVEGLGLPAGTMNTHALPSALQLFDERARRVQPAFSLRENLSAVADICRAVDGIPLAIELAAGWVHVMSCEAIASKIQNNIGFLKARQRDLPERHQSMRAVFDQSYKLLSEDEQDAFSTLSVFRGGFTAEAAKHVAGAALSTLTSFIDKSLIQLTSDGRYDLHDLLRQYGKELLEKAGTNETAREAHCAYYATFVASRVEDLKGRRQLAAIAEFNADFENARTAWIWAVDQKDEAIIEQLIDGLWIYCKLRERNHDGFALFSYGEKKFTGAQNETSQRLWGRLLARLAIGQKSQQQCETALEIARRYNDPAEMAFCLFQFGYAAYADQEYAKTIQKLEQSLTLYRQLGDAYATALVLHELATYDDRLYWDQKKTLGDEVLSLQRELGNRVGIGWSLLIPAIHEGRQGNFAEAERHWLEVVELGEQIGNPALIANGYGQLSLRVCFLQGDLAQARAAADESIRIGTSTGITSAINYALITRSLLASMSERYAESKNLAQKEIVVTCVDVDRLAAWSAALAECGSGNYEAARAQLAVAFQYLTHVQGTVGKIATLPVAAIIAFQEENPVYAVELLALAFTHPVRASGWMEQWPLLDRLQTDLELTLGPETYSEVWERGTQLNLDTVIAEIETQLFDEDQSAVARANRAYSDPLSSREIEVLELVADGLTNREIAERLFIGLSTVKKHINHIYAKLNVKNRTSAIARARDLKLLS